MPMEEIVRAFNYVIEKGWVRRLLHYVTFLLAYTRVKALYWGTSEWSAHEMRLKKLTVKIIFLRHYSKGSIFVQMWPAN